MKSKCRTCGAELLPGTSFCRQCGSAITGDLSDKMPGDSDDPTTSDSVPTQRLDPRTTSERPRRSVPHLNVKPPASSITSHRSSTRRIAIIWLGMIGLVLGVLSIIFFVTIRNHRSNTSKSTTANAELLYPGAKTVVDMSYDDGSRAIQLETTDSLTQVQSWYQASLKPSKTMRLTSGSVVLKNETTTATIVAEADKTNILIKKTP